MRRAKLFLIVIAVILPLTALSCKEYKALPKEIKTVAELEAVEIRDFNGEALSSILGWRENSIEGVQDVDIDNYKLEITGLVDEPASYTYDEVLKKDAYEKVVYLHCVEGWSKNILWEGVKITDLLGDAGIKPETNNVIFHAHDGYTTSLTLDYVRDNDILLAYKMNGVTIPPARGYPFVVVAEEKWGYKWCRWVTKIELTDDPDYRGFWEERGYNVDGDVNGPKSG